MWRLRRSTDVACLLLVHAGRRLSINRASTDTSRNGRCDPACLDIGCDRVDKIQSHLAVAARGEMSVIQEHLRAQSMRDICRLVTLVALIRDDTLHAAGQLVSQVLSGRRVDDPITD